MTKHALGALSILGLTLFFSLVLFVGIVYYSYIYQFKKEAHLSDQQIIELLQEGRKTPVKQTNGRTNFLILGLDELANRTGDPLLTDTILLASLNQETGELNMISLPRDLWSVEYKTKINALYEYGKERYPEDPQKFPKEVIEQMTTVPIHYTVVITLDQLKELIDTIGGVPVEIKESFVDEEFPRTDVDIRTERDPAKLYERVEFQAGTEVMSGDRALKYIRSRHSIQDTQDTDDARTLRQQAVIQGIITKVEDSGKTLDTKMLGKVFYWYSTHFSKYFSVEETISTVWALKRKVLEVQVQPKVLSVETESLGGVITHPPVQKYNQWVYEVKDIEAFRTELFTKLGIPLQ